MLCKRRTSSQKYTCNFACGLVRITHHHSLETGSFLFLLKVCYVHLLPKTGAGGWRCLRSWIPGRDRAERGRGIKPAKSLHLHPALRHNISLGVNIPSTYACLTFDESLCGGNASIPANGPFPSSLVPEDSGERLPEGIVLLRGTSAALAS